MKRGYLLILILLCGGTRGAPAAESAWRSLPVPGESAQWVTQAEEAATPGEAARLYALALRACPSNGPALFGLGGTLLRMDRPADSLKVFQRMDRLFPGDPEITVAIAVTLTRLPNLKRPALKNGIARLETALEQVPDDTECWIQLSILRHLNGQYADALDAARQALALDAETPLGNAATLRIQQQEIICQNALSVYSPLD